MSRRLRRTKIVTTLGPATDRDNNLEKSYRGGCQRCTYELFSRLALKITKCARIKFVRLPQNWGRHVAILGDLQGPKIRVSTFKEGKVFLNIGDKFLLDANLGKGEGDKEKVGIDYKGLPADVVPW